MKLLSLLLLLNNCCLIILTGEESQYTYLFNNIEDDLSLSENPDYGKLVNILKKQFISIFGAFLKKKFCSKKDW